MPEEKKKENFTFSDKIKDSKTAASKSFANRVSSRIGRDGKPKLTILERTKRDAPFLIAALVALLLLPFLYKYSGSVKEESVVTPSSAESVFDPERYAFAPDVENPDGEIAQLSARDPLDLIKGWGKEEEYEGSDDDLIDTDIETARYKDAYSQASAASAKKSAKDTNVDIEENTTNIYKKRAVAGARHSFKRAATKINPIGTGRKASTSGHGLGVTNWGGAVKKATQKVNTPSPKDSPKPVSLQPLQAAGKPARVNFGDAAAAMRQAKDALGKRDAEKAILDAQVKPMDPGSFGGMTLGDTKFGGGSGKIDRKFNYQPQTPWWWDEMKTRSHYAWQKKFDWKWGIYDWMTKLAEKFLDKFLGCLLTGSEDWKMEHFLGTAAGSGSEATCCGKKAKDIAATIKMATGMDFGEQACKNYKTHVENIKGECKGGWEDAKPAPRALNFFQTRGACLGASFGYDPKSQPPGLKNRWPCSALNKTHVYELETSGKAETWHTYHYVVVRNYVPFDFESAVKAQDLPQIGKGMTAAARMNAYKKFEEAGVGMTLCTTYNNSLKYDRVSAAGLSAVYNLSAEDRAYLMAMQEAGERYLERGDWQGSGYSGAMPKNREDLFEQMHKYAAARKDSAYKENNEAFFGSEQINPESLLTSCVIYVAEGDKFDWETGFKPQITTLLARMIEERGIKYNNMSTEELAVKMFNQLDLFLIEGMSSKEPLANKNHVLENLPMLYHEFIAAYIDRYGATSDPSDHGKRASIPDLKRRHEGHDRVTGARCYFNNSVKISCEDNTYPVQATVTFNGESFMGGRAGVVSDQPLDPKKMDPNFKGEKAGISVKAAYVPLLGGQATVDYQTPDVVFSQGNTVVYQFSDPQVFMQADKMDAFDAYAKSYKSNHDEDKVFVGVPGQIKWQLYRGGEMIGEASCEIDNAGGKPNTAVLPKDECENGEQTNPGCCKKLQPTWEWVGGVCEKPCNGNPQVSRRCCEELQPNWTWDDEEGCYQPGNGENEEDEPKPQAGEPIRFAPVLPSVPTDNVDCRKSAPTKQDVKNNHNDIFAQCSKIKGTEKGKREHCFETTGLMMDSQAALDFVLSVAKKYNETKKADQRPFAEEVIGSYPTDGEFVDALYVAKQIGIPEVKGDAVCELGRDMIRRSRDPHVGQNKNGLPTGYKGEKSSFKTEDYWHNELGSFLAYVALNSQLYPAQHSTGYGSKKVPDARFDVRALVNVKNPNTEQLCNETGCRDKDRGETGKSHAECWGKYHYNNYARVPVGKSIWSEAYKHSLVNLKLPTANPPLHELGKVKGIADIQHEDCGQGRVCNDRADKYRTATNSLLTEDSGFQIWKGNACSAAKGVTLQVEDVIKYVESVCEYGLDRKPHGVGSYKANTKRGNTRYKSTDPNENKVIL